MFTKTVSTNRLSAVASLAAITLLALGVACTTGNRADSNRANADYKGNVKAALEQADLKDVTVSEDADKNTITLGGKFTQKTRKTVLRA